MGASEGTALAFTQLGEHIVRRMSAAAGCDFDKARLHNLRHTGASHAVICG